MPAKKKILYVGEYNRADYVSLLKSCKGSATFIFLNFSSSAEESSSFYRQYGYAVYWKDFSDAYDLLKKLNPYKVIFLSIDTYNQIALNVAAKRLSIKTHVIDHGVQNKKFNDAFDQTQPKKKLFDRLIKILYQQGSLPDRLRTRFFFLNTVKKSSDADKAFLKSYFEIRKSRTPLETMQLVHSPLRLPDEYLCFSPFVYKWHQQLNNLSEDQPVRFTGIPYFDQLATIQPLPDARKRILFIDQAFVTQAILGWTPDLKLQFNRELISFCERHQLELLVKEHPLEKSSMWNHVQSKFLVIDNSTPIEIMATSAEVVIGFYSTLLLGLAALPHITLFTYEGHPGGNFGLSDFLVSRGVSTVFNKTEELDTIFANLAVVQTEQVTNKEAFIEECLYRFDGQSGERLKQYLLE